MSEATPFDPPDVDWRKVEPRLATVRLLGLLVVAAPVLVAGIVFCVIWPYPWTICATVAVALLFAWQAWLIPRRVRAMSYAVRDRDLFQRSGIMFRTMSVVPYVRIQYVDIRVGPIERAFNLASLTVSTASPTLTASLVGITPETAASLRDILTNRENLVGGTEEVPSVEEAPPAKADFSPPAMLAMQPPAPLLPPETQP